MDSSALFNVSTFAYIIAMIAYIAYLAFKQKGIGLAATGITAAGFLAQTAAIVTRWSESYSQWMKFSPESSMLLGISRSAPLRNLYESLVFFIWSMILIHLVIEYVYKNRSLGAFVTPIAGLALAFIEMAGIGKEIQPLVPALQSNWLIAHVLISFFGYGAFAISYATANMHIILASGDRKSQSYIFWAFTFSLFIWVLIVATAGTISGPPPEGMDGRSAGRGMSFWLPLAGIYPVLFFIVWRFGLSMHNLLASFALSADILDEITYKGIAIGFPLLTLGIITGAIWADSAWGTYWSWDPKETWSLITWFAYALYLHSRLMRGWRGVKTAILSLIGFISVVFTYLGVNLLLSGLHSYGGG
jgi:cytochrome c-type biogenesis protein CcsB